MMHAHFGPRFIFKIGYSIILLKLVGPSTETRLARAKQIPSHQNRAHQNRAHQNHSREHCRTTRRTSKSRKSKSGASASRTSESRTSNSFARALSDTPTERQARRDDCQRPGSARAAGFRFEGARLGRSDCAQNGFEKGPERKGRPENATSARTLRRRAENS